MNPMFRIPCRTFSLLCISLLASCGDDPELVKKRQEQKSEIARLEGELMMISEQLQGMPADRSADLATVKKKLDAQTQELEKLEAEISQLQQQKREAESRFAEFKRKYPITTP
jgi:chromosome segregation ATPase